MSTAGATLLATQPSPSATTRRASALIPQPERPRLPLKVPGTAEVGGTTLRVDVLGSSANVLLLQARETLSALPILGTPVRLRLDWDRQLVTGRLAAHGVNGRVLVTIGERAIRRSRRFSVNLAGVARGAHLHEPVDVRITDLSAGGARVEGVQLAVGSQLELQFTPPGRVAPLNVLGFVVRIVEPAGLPTVGVAFRLVQPSLDVLAASTPG